MSFSFSLRSSRHSAIQKEEDIQDSQPSCSSSSFRCFSFLRRNKSKRHSIKEPYELDRATIEPAEPMIAAATFGDFSTCPAQLEDVFHHVLVSRSIEIEIESLVNMNSLSISTSPSCAVFPDDENLSEFPSSLSNPNTTGGGTALRSGRNNRFRLMCTTRELDLIPPDAIEDLRTIASQMVCNGHGQVAVQVYGSARKSAINQSLRRLRIEKLSLDNLQQMDWDAMEVKIRLWIRSARIAIRVVFASERKLCRMVFDDEALEDASFSEAVKGSALQLLSFAETIVLGHRSADKLFKILDLHDCLSDLLVDMSVIFDSKSTESIHLEAEKIISLLDYAVHGILSEFENAVLKDPSQAPVPGGTVHPLTHYVINYISLISDYKPKLMKLITSRPSYQLFGTEQTILEDLDFLEFETPLAVHLVWIIFVLHQNLESKSQLYNDVALSHIFIMNNLHYIVNKVKDSPELYAIIGDSYLRILRRKLGQAAANYQRTTWMKILSCLRNEGLPTGGPTTRISKSTLKERFKTFNASFEEAHKIQSLWLVPNTQLKEELKISIAEKILPAYGSFLGRFRHHIENKDHPKTYIKYSVEDLEMAITDFFEGVQVPLLNRRKSH